MRKLVLLILSIFTIGFNLRAQNAETIFKSAVDKLLAYNNIAITFDYNMINTDASIYETMEGAAILQGDAYKLNIMGQDILCDGNTTWTYNADAEEVMISDVDKDSGSGTPLAIVQSFYDNITAKYLDEGNGDIRKIEAKTKTPDEDLNKLVVLLNTKTLEIKEIHVFDNNSNEFVYIINEFVTNQTLPADYFTFKESDYPDAEIIDMR